MAEPAIIEPLEPRRRSPTAILHAVHACLRAAAPARLSGEESRTFAALLLFIDENHQCFPAQRTLSELTGIDKRSVRRALDGLQGHDLLRRSSRWSEDGARLSDLYTIAPSATPLREDALPPSATPLRKDAHLKGETQTKSTCILNPEGERSGDDLGRSAPVLHSKEERRTSAAPSSSPLVNHPVAYESEVKFRKRQGWLKRMNDIISRTLQGRERAAAWDAIAQASQAKTRPESARRLLDALDKRFRAETRNA